jgi:hypothetical protein
MDAISAADGWLFVAKHRSRYASCKTKNN